MERMTHQDQPQISLVITSYSIHYTKLYDEVLNNTTEDNKEELEAILDVDSVLKAIAINTVMGNYDSYNGSKAHNYYLLYSDGKFSYIRITSYNVCYTKLLRSVSDCSVASVVGTVPMNSPRLSRITSYNVCYTKLLRIF